MTWVLHEEIHMKDYTKTMKVCAKEIEPFFIFLNELIK